MAQRLLGLLILLLTPALVGAAPPTVCIEKVLPYTGLDHVRLRMTVSSCDAVEVELQGQLSPQPQPGGTFTWHGSLGKLKLEAGKSVTTEITLRDLKVSTWTPATPHLYTLHVDAVHNGATLDSKSTRFGFRTFEARHGKFFLNGKPIFLRGIAINPPGRGLPEQVATSRKFAEDYVRFMREHNCNIIRLEPESDVWLDVCDELGMMVYQGYYSSPPGHEKSEEEDEGKESKPKKTAPPLDAALREYRNRFENYLHHPSVVVYVLSNELPYEGERGAMWHEFLTKVHAELKDEFPVPFIGNAGYGQGREGDVNDVHRYWGWYYNSHLTYYNLRDPVLFGDPQKAKSQPLTFSECVGAFTGPSGQFNLIFRKQLGAQLNWTGHAENQIEEAQKYQAFIFKHAAESFRTMRATNPNLSGLMPFTILFRNWVGVTEFGQMGHNANAEQMKISYSPVLLSLENWTPNVYSGTKLEAFAHVVNDSEDFSDLRDVTLAYELRRVGPEDLTDRPHGTIKLPDLSYHGTSRTALDINLPASLPSGRYAVHGVLSAKGRRITSNSFDVFVAGKDWRADHERPGDWGVSLYDPGGKTANALRTLGIAFHDWRPSDRMPAIPSTIVIGEGAWDAKLSGAKRLLQKWTSLGGRVLVLGQPRDAFDSSWLPAEIQLNQQSNNDPTYEQRTRPMSDGMHVNPSRTWHPVLAGITRDNLKWWSDYSGWDQTKPGFPDVYPVGYGFRLKREDDLARTAIIANYDRGLEALAIAEMFDGKGSAVMTSLRLVPRVGADPVADRMLGNLVRHVSKTNVPRELHPLIDSPIRWGDYPTERGVAVEPLGGLVVNCRWQPPPTAPDAEQLEDNTGAWNTQPGDGFVPHGRRVFGPWAYTNATGIRDLSDPANARYIADPGVPAPPRPAELDDVDNAPAKKESKASPTGFGQFWARIPAGRKWCVNKVENPTDEPKRIEVRVNDADAAAIDVPPQSTATVKAAVAGGATVVNVKYTADKTLVLLETSFE